MHGSRKLWQMIKPYILMCTRVTMKPQGYNLVEFKIDTKNSPNLVYPDIIATSL